MPDNTKKIVFIDNFVNKNEKFIKKNPDIRHLYQCEDIKLLL